MTRKASDQAPKLHTGLRQVIFQYDYPHLDQFAMADVEGRERAVFVFGGIDRVPNIIWKSSVAS